MSFAVPFNLGRSWVCLDSNDVLELDFVVEQEIVELLSRL